LASSPKKARELFSSLDLMIISHGHPDHFEREVIEALSANDICFVIPDFLIDKAKEMGLKEDKMIIARTGERISFKCLEILPFKGKHFRPISGLGTEEYGYLITLEDSTSLVFPVDVRDYTLDDSLPCGDYCFCNVWLEDDSANEESWRGVIDDFSSFALSLSKKNIILTHLYENGRGDDKMWMRHHAEAIKEAVKEKSPETRVLIPHCGENILLS